MDGGDLTPATRRRIEPEPRVPEVAPAIGEDGARMAALETSVRAIDVRLEYLERMVSTGFQEAASRSVVLAEATDEVLTRIETAVGEPSEPVDLSAIDGKVDAVSQRLGDLAAALAAVEPPEPVDVSAIDVKIDAVRDRLDDVAVAVVAVQPTLEAKVDAISQRLADVAAAVAAVEPPEPVDVSAIDVKIDAIRDRLDDLAVAVVALQPTIDAIVDLRSTVELVGGRLGELLGGPSLTELMDRLDEIADRDR